jgi:hypothetical protein
MKMNKAIIRNSKLTKSQFKVVRDLALRIDMCVILAINSLAVYSMLPGTQYPMAFSNQQVASRWIVTVGGNQTSTIKSSFSKNVDQDHLSTFSRFILIDDVFVGLNERSNDTTGELRKDNYLKTLKNERLTGGRTSRWYFAWEIFKEYPLQKKIFGGGFDYLKLFGEEYNEAKEDYPHNPFISAFLYSGLIGGFAYIIFMVSVCFLYIKYYRRHLFFLICFIIVFFFSFVSANSHFSVPIFSILCLIPFLTRYLVKKERISSSRNL